MPLTFAINNRYCSLFLTEDTNMKVICPLHLLSDKSQQRNQGGYVYFHGIVFANLDRHPSKYSKIQ